MKALSFQVPKPKDESVRVQVDHQPFFYNSYHYHSEIQISYIVNGTGTRIIGNSVGRFSSNELYVIGSNIPHLFKSDKNHPENESELSHAISFYFTENTFGEEFFNLSETKNINNLLTDAKRIVFYKSDSAEKLKNDFFRITKEKGFYKLQMFLKILYDISRLDNQKLLSEDNYEKRNIEKYGRRINDIFDFVINNYEKPISLDKAAEISNLSTTAFCRFFKERTRKSFTEFVNEVRIGEACKLLSYNDLNISQICYEVGFNNISNFNRKFKEITNLTPKLYRQTFQSNT